MMRTFATLVLLAAAGMTTPVQAAGDTTVLDCGQILWRGFYDAGEPGTVWRYHETWQTDLVRLDSGKLARVNVFHSRRDVSTTPGRSQSELVTTSQVHGSPFPPEDWCKAEFDDSGWFRHRGSFPDYYRSLALVCVRGRFEVRDLARVGELTLSVKFQGGAAAYLNGQEIGRAFLPEGPIGPDTPAQDYPAETFVDAAGELLVTPCRLGGRVFGAGEPDAALARSRLDDDQKTRFRKRLRTLDVKVPRELLCKGVNVLAVEVHRAPALPVMFTQKNLGHRANDINYWSAWNRACIERVTLTASGDAGAVVPNVARPAGLQVWTESVTDVTTPYHFADPNESLAPIRLVGLRNGAYSGQVVVGSRGPLRGLKVVVTDLAGPNGKIPAATNIRVRYPRASTANGMQNYDILDPEPPAEVVPPEPPRPPKDPAELPGAVQPVWVTVKVPRDTPPGLYTGTLTLSVDGEKPVSVPVEMRVVGPWVLPDSRDFTTFIGMHQSPDSVAMQYHTPLWSEAHWKHLDRIFELLGEVSVKDVYIPVITRTHLSNEETMVRLIRQPDGSLKPDFSIAERYLDLALKHLGKPRVVCLYIHDRGYRINDTQTLPEQHVTVVDSATGKLDKIVPPAWGTPEARTFWKPVIDGFRVVLAKRGLESALMIGMSSNNGALAAAVDDLGVLLPDTPWVTRTHYCIPAIRHERKQTPIGYSAVVFGVVSVLWDPDTDVPSDGWSARCRSDAGNREAAGYPDWRKDAIVVGFPRSKCDGASMDEQAWRATYRLCGEGSLLGGLSRGERLHRGIGQLNADFWPVLEPPADRVRRRRPAVSILGHYIGWHALDMNLLTCLLGPGKDGPVATCRHQMMREALQEAEARVFVQDALLDPDRRKRLGPELARRAEEVCNRRTRELHQYSSFANYLVGRGSERLFDETRWQAMSVELYTLASDVARALE
ncbi:MAG TPA: glycoside hydrolase domain-containing protein [Planctomycetota bacterium]|nr:glycoside hydrolase domain-containing protein [Planctomycetota bacterium]